MDGGAWWAAVCGVPKSQTQNLATKQQQHKRVDPECAQVVHLVRHWNRQRQQDSVDEGPRTCSHAMTQKRRSLAHAHPSAWHTAMTVC